MAPVLAGGAVRELAARADTRKMLIVRHPFARLLSAFRDKLELCEDHKCEVGKHYYHQRYGRHMVTRFRAAAIKRLGPDYFSKE